MSHKTTEDVLRAEITRLKAIIQKLEKPQLIKSTWQGVYAGDTNHKVADTTGIYTERRFVEQFIAPSKFNGNPIVSILRRDYYHRHDGSEFVETVMEPV